MRHAFTFLIESEKRPLPSQPYKVDHAPAARRKNCSHVLSCGHCPPAD
ncbi:hypothetical protein C4K07_3717 [Pseudomonas chlororaphis subsp. aureofaciens]|uniref:Uncharacterized protein n=1 Tax=Pseudomonas chlororaphis subsp. aureofaciens TaxID=587851 RepID=A0AAD1E7N2_9PSED|nr:hypothetical protein C4K07_3717 [Pseudomonas chlororaphis subsp. aureofaciens]